MEVQSGGEAKKIMGVVVPVVGGIEVVAVEVVDIDAEAVRAENLLVSVLSHRRA